jgi:hypothetical protein
MMPAAIDAQDQSATAPAGTEGIFIDPIEHGGSVLISSVPAATRARGIGLETPRPPLSGWLGLTFGYNRGRDRVFAHWALTDGIFADRIFADRRGGRDRLRPREVGSNCCSDEGQRSDAEDHELQHQSLHTVNHGSLESTKIS